MSSQFQPYLESIRATYEKWWQLYTLTDAAGKERQAKQAAPTFDFGLMVQTVKKEERREEEKIERFPVLEGIRKYAEQHVLLVGRPGSGKSTALARLMLEEVTIASSRLPVLVELRYWQGSIEQLIRDSFTRHDLPAELFEEALKRSLILFDGVNELPSEEARSQLSAFRRNHPKLPMIFTTRDLSIGGDLGIEQQLEMQPLTEAQMQTFIRAYVPEQAEAMLRQLKDRLREFGQTPLLLWMLCGVFQQTGTIPENLGLVFREFTQGYERYLKDDVRIESDRAWWKPVLQQLAWVMMQGEKPTEFRVAIRYEEAVGAIAQFLKEKVPYAEDFARKCLRDLQKHHLIQAGTKQEELEFRHQLIQEYYAAEALLERVDRLELEDEQLKQEYLNFLKWTEPVALMVELVDEVQAVRVIKLARDVDWRLAVRLAGDVKREFRKQVMNLKLFDHLKVPNWLQRELNDVFKKIKIPIIKEIFDEDYYDAEFSACSNISTDAHRELESSQESPLIKLLSNKDFSHNWAMASVWLGQTGSDLPLEQLFGGKPHGKVFFELVKQDSEETILHLLSAMQNHRAIVRSNAAFALGKKRVNQAISELFKALEDEVSNVRLNVVEALLTINSKEVVPGLIKALQDREPYIRRIAASGLGEMRSEQEISEDSKQEISELVSLLSDQSPSVQWNAAKAIGKFKGDQAAYILPHLLTLIPTNSGQVAYHVILAIQKNCKYYNYEIYQAHLESQKDDRQTPQNNDRSYIFPNATEVKIFENVDRYYETNSDNKENER